jgi:SAM-dependent methyltransferase
VSPQYEAHTYWHQIHAAAADESAVGYPELATSFNRAMYEVMRRNVSRAISDAGLPRPERVLDVGSGTGMWIDYWRRMGAREITGVDLNQIAVRRLRVRYPEHEFLQLDLGEVDVELPRGMDVVSAMSVLLHITDDARFEQALRSVLGSVRCGGSIILIEPVIVHRYWGPPFGPESNSKPRPLHDYLRVLADAGFEMTALRPAACLLANVIDTRHNYSFRMLERYWSLLGALVGQRERLGRVVGGLLRAVDLKATHIVRPGTSAKIILARRNRSTHRRIR